MATKHPLVLFLDARGDDDDDDGDDYYFFPTGFYSYRTLTFLNGLLDPQTFGRTPWLGDQSNAGQEVYSDKNSYIVIFRQQYAGQKGKGKK